MQYLERYVNLQKDRPHNITAKVREFTIRLQKVDKEKTNNVKVRSI